MTKKCPKCGNEFDAELTTCPTCGYSLTDTTVDKEEAETTSTNIDFETQERIPKDSALWYKEVIKTNGECLSINDDRRV